MTTAVQHFPHPTRAHAREVLNLWNSGSSGHPGGLTSHDYSVVVVTPDQANESEPQSPDSQPGFEVIPLDLSSISSVEDGLAQADERYRALSESAAAAIGFGPNAPLFREHMTLMSLTARASSLHKGIVSTVRESNPHAALTLLRAYLELVVTGLYLDGHPDYISALERPMSELPRGTRRRFSELFELAAVEMPGVRPRSRFAEYAPWGFA